MMNAYRKWLCKQNESTGKPIWWVVFGLGLAIVLAWVAAALPYIGTMFKWNSLGEIVVLPTGLGLIIYRFWTLPDPVATYYIVGVILSVALAMFGWLIAEIGFNYGRGLRYYMPASGHPCGYWLSESERLRFIDAIGDILIKHIKNFGTLIKHIFVR